MQPVGLPSTETLICCKCGKPASFMSPIGALCTTDALIGAAFHDWIPTHISNSSDREGDDFSVVRNRASAQWTRPKDTSGTA